MVGGSIRTGGGAINDINATTSKHGSTSSQAGGIINNKFQWNTASNKRNPFVCDKLTRRLVRPVCNSRLRAWARNPSPSSPSFHHFFSSSRLPSPLTRERSRISQDKNCSLYAQIFTKKFGQYLYRANPRAISFSRIQWLRLTYIFFFCPVINLIACSIWVNENDTLINF